MKKERIDVLCVEQGLFESREKAKRAIMAGIVRDDYDYIDKPGTKIPVDSHLYIKAKEVYALDVGTNQLAWKLRNDPRVHVMEQTNFRYATLEMFSYGQPDFASIDVSFISLKHIFPALSHILKTNGYFVALIKPQFEAGKDDVGKHGIVSQPDIHKRVISQVIEYAHESHFSLKGLTYSPITGGVGNIEFLACFQNCMNCDNVLDIDDIVQKAHLHFKG